MLPRTFIVHLFTIKCIVHDNAPRFKRIRKLQQDQIDTNMIKTDKTERLCKGK